MLVFYDLCRQARSNQRVSKAFSAGHLSVAGFRGVTDITGARIHFGSSRLVCVWFAVSIKMPYLATRRIAPGMDRHRLD